MRTFGQYMFIGGAIVMIAAFFMPVSLPAGGGLLDGVSLANTDLMSQRAMVHLSGAAAFIAGAVFWVAGHFMATKGGARPPDKMGEGQY